MRIFILDRFRYSFSVLKRMAWRFLVAAPSFVVGTFALVRDEFLPADAARKLKVLGLLPGWPWYWWAIGTLIILLILVLEGSYREAQDLIAAVADAKARIALNDTAGELAKEMRLLRKQRDRELDPIQQALRKAFE